MSFHIKRRDSNISMATTFRSRLNLDFRNFVWLFEEYGHEMERLLHLNGFSFAIFDGLRAKS